LASVVVEVEGVVGFTAADGEGAAELMGVTGVAGVVGVTGETGLRERKVNQRRQQSAESKRSYCSSTSFEILKVFARFHLDGLVLPCIEAVVVVATGLQEQAIQVASAIINHVGLSDLASVKIVLNIPSGVRRVNGEGKDARVDESSSKDDKVGGKLHIDLRIGWATVVELVD